MQPWHDAVARRHARRVAVRVFVVVLLALGAIAVVTLRPGVSATAGRPDVAAVVARALPAVVSITTRQIEHDEFNQPITTRGLGSGFIIDAQGHVLTNAHVVTGADEIKVALPDERTFRAVLVGIDRFTDLALLRIDAARLPVLSLGDSAALAVGNTVVAIGSPLWIEGGPTVTTGIVSGLGRSLEDDGLPTLHGLIQTDAAINAGNSGGPLLDLRGRVVGIATAMIPSAHGIGFAIAIDAARPVVRRLLEGRRISRTSLGISAVSVTPQVAFANELASDRGVLVKRVDAAGRARAAGLEPGDLIVGFAGTTVRDLHQLHALMFERGPGERVELVVWRGRYLLKVNAVLSEEDR